ncbi:MAG: hypothetical protein JSU94_13480 [Phycisphaerales bacterium]|nr:MAG: hypothetical protein JSU94_13480 [Phycisphaerales bacterium]
MSARELTLEALPGAIRDSVRVFAERLIAELGGNLKSITVVGSSLTGEFRPGKSDVNTVLVLGERPLEALGAIAALAKPMHKMRISAPLLMTKSYIERSRDVFGVELLDFQQTHKTVLGQDPFAGLNFEKKDIRLQCERELKATLIRLRQGYIAAAGNRGLVRDILVSTAKGMAPLLRGMLWLKDAERPVLTDATFAKAAEAFSVNADGLLTASRWRHERTRPGETDIQSTFEAVYAAVDTLAMTVDELEVG